ncbi:MAG TPA: tetratricopeptide repeat protein [Chthoniobacterales bacterium]|nr:tetratricopeptide repeat protein [Chthoniobacterales bacterium]
MPTLSSTDPVLETQVFWERYKKVVFTVLALALLTVAGWGGYRFYSDRRAETAAGLLATAKSAADFQKIIAQYGTTAAGQSAYLFLAEEQRKEKKFSEANTTLQSFVDKHPTQQLKGIARMAIAANLESLGKRDEALTAYQRLAADDAQGFTAPIALLAQVHIFKEKNQIAEARRVCEAIMTQYRESLVASEATRQLRLLKGNEPEPPAQPAQLMPASGATPMPATSAGPSVPAPAATLPAAVPAAPPAAVPPARDTPQTTASPKRER